MQRNHSEINRFGVIAIGRLADQKDYSTLLRAWKIVEYRIPSAQLKIYGNGDRVAINLLISQLGIRNVINLPSIPDILEQIKKHRILVSSSKFEGFPNVVLESLSCGIPVVSTRSSDIIDEFAMKGGVKACDVSDYLELANLIVEMIENDSGYKSMKKRALETVKDFRWSKISPFWEQVFEAAELSNGVRIGLHK
jgi:glycosyltransferase involved in cell wall biosynthesis